MTKSPLNRSKIVGAPETKTQVIAVLGGGFDPVHFGHIAIADIVQDLLKPTQLRIIPTGLSKNKEFFYANAIHRVAMLKLAFQTDSSPSSVFIDDQEIRRAEHEQPSYSVDTLTNIRSEVGVDASLSLVLGADQLQQLQHWKHWKRLLDLSHIIVVTRPGFDPGKVDHGVAEEFERRASSVAELRNSPFGHTYLYSKLNIDISSTKIRTELSNGNKPSSVPSVVLDYLQQHHLYKNYGY